MATTRFWQGFKTRALERGLLPERTTLKEPYYLNFRSGTPGMLWSFQRHKQGTRINLHFWLPNDPMGTLRLYERVSTHRVEIEAALGEALVWQVNRAGANIALEITDRPISADECESAVFDALLNGMLRFQRAIGPWL